MNVLRSCTYQEDDSLCSVLLQTHGSIYYLRFTKSEEDKPSLYELDLPEDKSHRLKVDKSDKFHKVVELLAENLINFPSAYTLLSVNRQTDNIRTSYIFYNYAKSASSDNNDLRV